MGVHPACDVHEVLVVPRSDGIVLDACNHGCTPMQPSLTLQALSCLLLTSSCHGSRSAEHPV